MLGTEDEEKMIQKVPKRDRRRRGHQLIRKKNKDVKKERKVGH